MRFTRFTTLSLGVLLLAAFSAEQLQAQDDYGGYPVERVRVVRPEGQPISLLYTEQRVLFQAVNLVTDGRGMTLMGGVITDFDADIVPADSDVPRGQLQVEVEIGLYHVPTNLRRRQGGVEHPRLDPVSMGTPVEGQRVTVQARDTFGPYGYSEFRLPTLERPLAPGIYRLVATVTFAGQQSGIRRAIKYCSSWYGAKVIGADPVTFEPIFEALIDNAEEHEKYYDQIINDVRRARSIAVLYIGDTIRDEQVTLVPPHRGSARNPTNYMIWHSHLQQIEQVMVYENQLVEIEAELERRLGAQGVDPQMRRRFEDEAAIDRMTARANITRLGGASNRAEVNLYRSHEAARGGVLEDIMRFEEYLTQRYWCLTEGHLLYDGWHTMNSVGFNTYDAISRGDREHQPNQRKQQLAERREAEGGLEALWERRREAWRFYPREVWDIFRTYMRNKEESDKWDGDKFTVEDAGMVLLDRERYGEFRIQFITHIIEKVNPLIEELRTTNVYANQVWSVAFAELEAARDAVIALSFAYEFHIRVHEQKEPTDRITEDWNALAQQMPGIDLQRLFTGARGAPGSIKVRFDGYVRNIRSATGFNEFLVNYRRAVESGAAGRDLPGSRGGQHLRRTRD